MSAGEPDAHRDRSGRGNRQFYRSDIMDGSAMEVLQQERLLRFIFPERPGALLKFLSLMRPDWNISLFHYRNQGADYGRILVGLQVPTEDNAEFSAFLSSLGYPWVEETHNPAYQLFLQSA